MWSASNSQYPEENVGYRSSARWRITSPDVRHRCSCCSAPLASCWIAVAWQGCSSARRGRERVVVRAAMKASRGSLLRQLVVEAGVLAAVAGIAGIRAAYAGVRAAQAGPEEIPAPGEIALDGSRCCGVYRQPDRSSRRTMARVVPARGSQEALRGGGGCTATVAAHRGGLVVM
jgi:hypothetical protein